MKGSEQRLLRSGLSGERGYYPDQHDHEGRADLDDDDNDWFRASRYRPPFCGKE